MTAPQLGTARGDLSVYAGRILLGFIRSGLGSVYVYDASGAPVGTFADQKAAQAALASRAVTAKEAAL